MSLSCRTFCANFVPAIVLAGLLGGCTRSDSASTKPVEYESVTIAELNTPQWQAPTLGRPAEVEGVVVADFRNADNDSGIFLQPPAADANEDVSGGLFVRSELDPSVQVGDHLRIRGTVVKVDDQPAIGPVRGRPLEFERVDGEQDVSAIEISLSASDVDLDAYLGMLVRVADELTVVDTYQLCRNGDVTVADSLLFVPTESIDPNDVDADQTSIEGDSNVEAVNQKSTENRNRQLTINFGSDLGTDRSPLFSANDQSLRRGARIRELVGVLTRSNGGYAVRPTTSPDIEYPTRPSRPDLSDPNLVIAGFNVLNLFSTMDDGTNQARGADSEQELTRQTDKLVTAILELDADIVALMELENNLESEEFLVSALNTRLGRDAFDGVGVPEGFADAPGGDNAIRVGVIYRNDKVFPVNNVQSIEHVSFADARTPLVQEFRRLDGRETISLIVNHFKSKSNRDAEDADRDRGDGQAAFNHTRREQATAVADFALQQSSDGQNVLVVGDLNAYGQEDPIDVLRAAGLTDLLATTPEDERYTYVYFGEAGRLDHAFANEALAAKLTGAAIWHINADEPRCLDYNLEQDGGRNFQADSFRSSDHDPILIGFQLD